MGNFGIEFGTFFTKLSYIDDNFIPINFKFTESQFDIPNILTQGEDGKTRLEHPTFYQEAHNEQVFHYEFRSSLSLIDPENFQEDNTRNFFSQIFQEFKKGHSDYSPDDSSVVMALPNEWYLDESHPAPDRIRKLFKSLGFQGEKISFASETTCAATWFTNWNNQLEKPYDLLICDIGGGSSKFTHCTIIDDQIEIIQTLEEPKISGNVFDSDYFEQLNNLAAIDLENERMRFSRKHAIETSKRGPNDIYRDPVTRIRALVSSPDVNDTQMFTNERYSLSISKVLNIYENIQDILLERLREFNLDSIDHVLLIGGFGQFPWIIDTIQEYIDCNCDGQKPHLHKENQMVISQGAALFSVGKGLFETYPHRIELTLHGVRDGVYQSIQHPVVDSSNAYINTKMFLKGQDGKPIYVKVKQNSEILLSIDSPERIIRDHLPLEGIYRIEVEINRSGKAKLNIVDGDNNFIYAFPINI